MQTLELGNYTTLPYRQRLVINLLSTVMQFFTTDERVSALTTLLFDELEHQSSSDQEFNAQTTLIAETMKLQHRLGPH